MGGRHRARAWAEGRETFLVVSEVSPTPCPMVLEHPLLDWTEVGRLLADLTHSYFVPALF